jgi:hypothetical protein
MPPEQFQKCGIIPLLKSLQQERVAGPNGFSFASFGHADLGWNVRCC